ncbi:MAG: phosphatidate cytidylyltransferase [Polyangiaceae bacterium]|jgi:phosphatidate cytidylyltransferase
MATANLAVRVATAAVAVPIILGLVYFAPPWCFYVGLILPSILIGAYEFFAMTHPLDGVARAVGILLSGGVSLAYYLRPDDVNLVTTLLLGVPLLAPIVTLARLGSVETAAYRIFAFGYGPLFVGVPLTLLAVMQRALGAAGPGAVILALGLGWFGDTGAYFVGRSIGRRKLCKAVSPKKTVEGAVGGLIASAAWGLAGSMGYLHGVLPIAHALPLAVAGGVLGQAGDLGESLIKRSSGVKDSGALVPGHGGMLDRVDSVIMSTVAVFLYARWTGWR